MPTSESEGEIPLQVDKFNKLIHEPARLLIMAHLYVVESADFLFLMRQIGMTFGNLSSHMAGGGWIYRCREGVHWEETQHKTTPHG